MYGTEGYSSKMSEQVCQAEQFAAHSYSGGLNKRVYSKVFICKFYTYPTTGSIHICKTTIFSKSNTIDYASIFLNNLLNSFILILGIKTVISNKGKEIPMEDTY